MDLLAHHHFAVQQIGFLHDVRWLWLLCFSLHPIQMKEQIAWQVPAKYHKYFIMHMFNESIVLHQMKEIP